MAYNFISREDYPIAETQSGKLRGYVLDDVFTFRGIPYAKAERFMPPQPVEPWEGVRNARTNGYVCPPDNAALTPNERMITTGLRFWPDNEDCLNLNLWTPTMDKNAKKPVMVFCHGGGFAFGSAMELDSYDPSSLSKNGDVVVVMFNHRLNFLGFLNLSAFGERYETSGTVGIQDMVAVLNWVQDNIAAFGGDPENVTIFGQSGGGGKVQALMQTPSAQGKFHKAIIQSGACANAQNQYITHEMAVDLGRQVAEELGLTQETIGEIEIMERRTIEKAYYAAAAKIADKYKMAHSLGMHLFLAPAPDDYFPGFPMHVGFLTEAKKTPVLIGTCIAEWGTRINYSCGTDMPEEKKMALLAEAFGEEHVAPMVAEFRKAYPGKDLISLYLMDDQFRRSALEILNTRSSDPEAASIFSYILAYDFPLNGGFPAWHCAEIPMVFGTTERIPTMHDSGVLELSKKMQAAWASFAYTGVPASADIPKWEPFTQDTKQTMILDAKCHMASDHDSRLVEMVQKYRTVG